MDQTKFVQSKAHEWTRLRDLAQKLRATPRNADKDELIQLVRLYRSASADLAVLQSEQTNPTVANDLNRVLQEAHEIIYRHRQAPFGEAILNTLHLVAKVTRRRAKYILAAIVMFFIGVAMGAGTMEFRPELRHEVIAPQMESAVDHWKSGQHAERGSGEDSIMWGFYASNNPRVALISGALAASTFGLGTYYLMYSNGLLMGGLGHEVQSVGKLGFLLSSIMPHGASELTGMFISGASGLVLAVALIMPGRRSRFQSLRHAAPDAMILLVQSMVMMLIAAPFEAFFSFKPEVPGALKVIVGIVVLGAWLAYWNLMGRQDEPAV